ncbi:hypothetical protein KP509_33G007200 [Ceratopteris richardii]|uniref:BUB1 N-terminal domain-containing protein n=2 Tax=Ceratopteris richardii TaxID=49495 RepID=A0A8T2QMJ0_CERRI|nr:hypothetical protein KP509_33G007200 [Ceratopteris richardii]
MATVVPDDDPLLSWIRSIRQVKQTHAEDKSKIFPHVSACYREFKDSIHYRNDPRFLRICIQLADCSPDPLKLMTELDERGIGHIHALFYEAYATSLEAKRRFGDANSVYKRGLASQAQPIDKLMNSYNAFRDRMETRKKRKQDQNGLYYKKNSSVIEEPSLHSHDGHVDNRVRHMEACQGAAEPSLRSYLIATNLYTVEGKDISFEELRLAYVGKSTSCRGENDDKSLVVLKQVTSQSTPVTDKLGSGSFGEETIQIRNFAAGVITGKEQDVEDARHHGLVDPTINTKEALQDILSMFCKPLDINKNGMGKPSSKKLSYTGAAGSLPSYHDDKRGAESVNSEIMLQPLGFSVFKDDEREQPRQQITNSQAPLFPLFNDENQKVELLVGSLNSEPLELSVYQDDEQDQPKLKFQKASGDHCHYDPEGKRQSYAETRNSEFYVFRDDESET